MKKVILYIAGFLFIANSCISEPNSSLSGGDVNIFPDYTNVTVPSNIAPTNFIILDSAQKIYTILESGNIRIEKKGKKIRVPIRRWRELTSQGKITVTVYEKKGTEWTKMKPFFINVTDEIDPFVTYRVIPPSFESFQKLSIVQRNLTNFKEKTIYSNQMVAKGSTMQCINCHSFKNWHTDDMQFHIRQQLGGTIIYSKGQLAKINLKTDSTLSAGVYPSWHPTHNYIAYSTNRTYQELHTNHSNRVEVYDEYSDLILYDPDNNAVSIIENDSTELECFPYWAPDGKTLFYVSAHIGNPTLFYQLGGVSASPQSIRYNLYSKPFNPENRSWGKKQLLIRADSIQKSITLPRVSPDGRWMMFTMGNQGVFHIWHKDSELYLMNLENGQYRSIDEINSSDVESYHSWSSSGKWVVFSTRRDDGVFTRLYLSYMSNDGHFSKPFPLPQKDPEFSRKFLYSYNIPEFTVEPVKVSAKVLASFIKANDAEPVSFEQKRGE